MQNLSEPVTQGGDWSTVRGTGVETSKLLLDGTDWLQSSMISLIHQARLWKEMQCIRLSFFPMLSLTTDINIECPAAESAEIKRQLDKYLAKGWIRPSCSPWGALIIFIRKKTGKLRMGQLIIMH